MIKKIYLKPQDVSNAVHNIIRQMNDDSWRPDYIVGLTRGGLQPALMLSHYLNIPMETLKVSLRDGDTPESNLWMAEDAFGYDTNPKTTIKSNPDLKKKILIVDDINDTGATLNWIREDWPSGCMPGAVDWGYVFNNNVRFAVIVDNESSHFKDVDYSAISINKFEEPSWVVFPWENWWE